MNKSESIANLAKAFVAAQAELKNPPLDSSADTGKYKYSYVSLAAVRDAVTAVFSRHGLAVLQSAGSGKTGPTITTLLLHASGEWLESDPLEVPVAKNDAQGYGSAITYGRRYALQAVANVVGDSDDDAQAAVRPPAPQKASVGTVLKQPAGVAASAQTPDWLRNMHGYDARLAEQGLCAPGDLVKHVAAAGKKGGFPADMTAWNETQVTDARAEARHFEFQRRAALQKTA